MDHSKYKAAADSWYQARIDLDKARLAYESAKQRVIAAKERHDDVLHGRDIEREQFWSSFFAGADQ